MSLLMDPINKILARTTSHGVRLTGGFKTLSAEQETEQAGTARGSPEYAFCSP